LSRIFNAASWPNAVNDRGDVILTNDGKQYLVAHGAFPKEMLTVDVKWINNYWYAWNGPPLLLVREPPANNGGADASVAAGRAQAAQTSRGTGPRCSSCS